MNWLDVVLVVIIIVAAIMGRRTGLIGAAITAIGALIGWLLASQLSDKVGGLFDGSLSNDTIVTVISFAIIVVVAVVVARVVGRIVRPMLSIATLGLSSMVDRLGGVVMGLIVGFAIAGAFIILMARFAYNFELPDEGLAGTVARQIPKVEDTRERVEDGLTGSVVVPVFIDVTDAIPGGALGFVPSDFKVALDILEQNIEEESSS